MHLIDWLIMILPVLVVIYIGFKTQKYVKGVSDFLTAGRVAGRYVLCVANGEAAMGLISLVAMYESFYKSGFAYGFWGAISSPILIVLAMTGYCVYRFRETRAMTMGQFLEIRYSRNFRIFAGILQSISGIINYALFPAVGARFVVYYCGLPAQLEVLGWVFPTFALLMAAFLAVAVIISTLGGQITIMTTDCIQGILSYPMYVVIVFFLLSRFSWFNDMAPVMLDRDPGKSLINPFDIANLRDFNIFWVIVGIIGAIINRMGWSGTQGYNAAAKDAHEQKIGGVLGTWRSGFSSMMYILLAVAAFTYLNSDKFQSGPTGAVSCRTELATKSVNDVISGPANVQVRQEVIQYINTGEVTPTIQDWLNQTEETRVLEEQEKENIRYVAEGEAEPEVTAEEPFVDTLTAEERQAAREARVVTARDAIKAVDPAGSQTFLTIFGQMRVPMALRYILPIGVTGIFCAVCIFLMISTDTTYLHSWGSIVAQDIILPIRRKPFTPKQQLRLLRLLIAGVAIFAFFFSYFFGQVDYILMFFAITGTIWLGGCGPVIVGGLYWKRGTTAGAWVALITGSSLAVGGIILQNNWVSYIYPWLFEHGMVETVAVWLRTLSAPFEPIIEWRMNSDKFPINSQEIYGFTMLLSIALYVIISLITCRKPFNMDRMLHRGIYHREGTQVEKQRFTFKSIIPRLIGITNQYTTGDKILAWSVFIWSFGWGFGGAFVGVVIWNAISPWGNHGWSIWFFLNNFIIAGTIGVVSTVWFTIGGIFGLRDLFRSLAANQENILDDGRVVGHVSADDAAILHEKGLDEDINNQNNNQDNE
ncbi:MAG: hypothetical protein JW936_08525 [Sedimentisphaerales bacterium]|nr:hypothetical protein [Sedimentisphaerales bacterium]